MFHWSTRGIYGTIREMYQQADEKNRVLSYYAPAYRFRWVRKGVIGTHFFCLCIGIIGPHYSPIKRRRRFLFVGRARWFATKEKINFDIYEPDSKIALLRCHLFAWYPLLVIHSSQRCTSQFFLWFRTSAPIKIHRYTCGQTNFSFSISLKILIRARIRLRNLIGLTVLVRDGRSDS